MRHSLLNSVLEVLADNTKHHDRVQVFEVGHLYMPGRGGPDDAAILPAEASRVVIALTGPREMISWLPADTTPVDFFDLKGVIEALLAGLHVANVTFAPTQHHAYFPGRLAELTVNGQAIGVFGQLHPLVVASYEMQIEEQQPVLAAELDLDLLSDQVPEGHVVQSVPRFPPVQQDIAVIVDEAVSAEQVQAVILQTGQPLLAQARLFDVYRGEQIGAAKKSLAYSLTFQSEERTLTDKVVARQQQNIVSRLERELGATLRR